MKVIVEGEPLEPATPVLDAEGKPLATLPAEPDKDKDLPATVVVAPNLPPFPDQAVTRRRYR